MLENLVRAIAHTPEKQMTIFITKRDSPKTPSVIGSHSTFKNGPTYTIKQVYFLANCQENWLTEHDHLWPCTVTIALNYTAVMFIKLT